MIESIMNHLTHSTVETLLQALQQANILHDSRRHTSSTSDVSLTPAQEVARETKRPPCCMYITP